MSRSVLSSSSYPRRRVPDIYGSGSRIVAQTAAMSSNASLEIADLIALVDEIAEIPNSIRNGTEVRLVKS